MHTWMYIMVSGISDYFLRQDPVSEIIGPNDRKMLKILCSNSQIAFQKSSWPAILPLVLHLSDSLTSRLTSLELGLLSEQTLLICKMENDISIAFDLSSVY